MKLDFKGVHAYRSRDEIASNQSHALTGEDAENDETNFLCFVYVSFYASFC